MKTKLALLLSATLFVAIAPAFAAEPDGDKDKNWRETETWYEFTDRETTHSFKGNKPKVSRPSTVVTPLDPTSGDNALRVPSIFTPPPVNPTAASGDTYILTPPSNPVEPPATTHVETTWVPTGQQNNVVMPFWGGVAPYYGGRNWFGNGYWGGGGWGRNNGWGYSPWASPLGLGMMNNGPGMRPIKKLVQDRPSKASGNYYAPSTPDPTASGNYYAGSGDAPRASSVYQPEAQPKDYWGNQGSPLPPEMQPQ